MRTGIWVCVLAGCAAATAPAGVFINEVLINPPGSADDTHEFIELLGTPGMRLDGYAVAICNGALQKHYPAGSIPPVPAVTQEIDEFFSLDGLSLGANGILVIGIGVQSNYSTLLVDSNYRRWNTIWNGGLDTPGKLSNDGANTILLLRNRPGRTQADPTNPAGLRWGKDIDCDFELYSNLLLDPNDPGSAVDQLGDGNLDRGDGTNPFGQPTLDLKGVSTLADISDDLEVVDEVSYEQDQGWEYDLDGRRVDLGGSTIGGLPERRVHALDDPQGFNPDALTRVDYRTAGPGWTPAPGATGELPNGNNWQDTATEQWIRGESLIGTGGQGDPPQFFFDNAANANPDAIQPYMTNVPLSLDDGTGDDYVFNDPNGVGYSYQIMAGRINPLAIAYLPGDADRDGDVDGADIAKIAAAFGDDEWVFSNSFSESPEGDSGDPAAQTRPWDVDQTGDNGIEASDLQWALNFQEDTTGRIVGVRYDSTTPSTEGVHLNSNAGVACSVTASAAVQSGNPLGALQVGDLIELTVRAQVTAGANNADGQQNGVTQFVHDVALTSGGVVRAVGVVPLGTFDTPRSAIQSFAGASGDLGVRTVNGYTGSFANGLGGAADLYRVTLEAVGPGTTSLTVVPATMAKFAASTPGGLKLGHTRSHGNPASAAYPSPLALTVQAPGGCAADLDGSGAVDLADLSALLTNFGQPAGGAFAGGDIDGDGDVDLADLSALLTEFGSDC